MCASPGKCFSSFLGVLRSFVFFSCSSLFSYVLASLHGRVHGLDMHELLRLLPLNVLFMSSVCCLGWLLEILRIPKSGDCIWG